MWGYFMCILVLGYSQVVPVTPSSGCPYMFNHGQGITNLCDGSSHTSGASVQMMLCCEEVYGAAVYAIAQYTNSTGTMFLESSQAEICIDLYKQELIQLKQIAPAFFDSFCPLPASRITSYASSCNFGQIEELMQAVDLKNVSDACGQRGNKGCQECQAQLLQATVSLASRNKDQPGACGTAIAIALTSFNPNQVYFENFYTCVLQILGGVPISQYLNITTAPTVAPGQSLQQRSSSLSSRIVIILMGAIGGLVLLVFLVLAGLYVMKKRKKSDFDFMNPLPVNGDRGVLPFDTSEIAVLPTEGFYIFTLKELAKATNHFSNASLLGEGSAGKVYIGQLPSGKLVAVKRIQKERKVETFYKEVELLARIRHPNLTALLGYCRSKHVCLLVYEYMSNGDLAQKLLRKEGPTLTWEQRLQIAIDCARGLTYLHECPEGPIVHRDIKPTNILLNGLLEAKLSDFGLSKIIELDASHVSTEIKGTTGYLDPEYLILGQLTEASDVYSFGIVLLQLLSGRKAIDNDTRVNRSIVEMAMSVIGEKNELSQILDPRLDCDVPLPAFQKLAEVAHMCVQPRSYDRPSISEVLLDLELALRLTRRINSPRSTRAGDALIWPTWKRPTLCLPLDTNNFSIYLLG